MQSNQKWVIQTQFIYGWDYVGSTEDDKGNTVRDLYSSEAEANAEIDDLCRTAGYDRDEWRAVIYDPEQDSMDDL